MTEVPAAVIQDQGNNASDLSSVIEDNESFSLTKQASNKDGAKKRNTKLQKKKAEKEAKTAIVANENSSPREDSVKSQ